MAIAEVSSTRTGAKNVSHKCYKLSVTQYYMYTHHAHHRTNQVVLVTLEDLRIPTEQQRQIPDINNSLDEEKH